MRFLRQNAGNKVSIILKTYSRDAMSIDICPISSVRTDKPISLTCLGLPGWSWMRLFHAVKAPSILNRSAMLTIWWVLSISASGSFAHREIEDKRLFIRAAIWPERLNLLRSLSSVDSRGTTWKFLLVCTCRALKALLIFYP